MIIKIGNMKLREETSEDTSESEGNGGKEKSEIRFMSVENDFRLRRNEEDAVKKFDGVEGGKISGSESETITEGSEGVLKDKVFREETSEEGKSD